MKPTYFSQCSCCINIDKHNYPEETELDTNPSLTLAQTLTLSTVERKLPISGPVVVTTPRFFLFYVHEFTKKFGGWIQSLDQKSI